MTIYSVLLFIVFISGLSLSAKVRRLDRDNSLYRLTSYAIFIGSLLAFWEFEISKVKAIETIIIYDPLHTLLSTLTIYLGIISIWLFTQPIDSQKYPWVNKALLLLYTIPPVTILLALAFTDFRVTEGFEYVNRLWAYKLKTIEGALMITFFSFYAMSLISFIYGFWKFYSKCETPKKRRWRKNIFFIMFTTSLGMFVAFIFNGSEQQQGYYFVSPWVMICYLALSWAYSNFKLFVLSPVSALDNIMDSMSNLMAITDNEFNVKYLNRACREEMFIGDSDITGLTFHNFAKVYNYQNWDEVSKQIKALKINEKYQNDFEFSLGPIGLYYQITISPIFNDHNEKKGYVAIGTNITPIKQAQLELKKYNKKLEDSNLELERFAYIASHDLKTPLRNVVSFLSLIQRRIEKSEDHELLEFIHIANNSASQMYHLIQDVLEYSQINRAEQLTLYPVDLNKSIANICQTLNPMKDENKGSVIADYLPTVMGDEVRLNQLFQNIIENGLKYNQSPNPKVYISYEKKNEFFHFFIKDNGIGIKEEYRERIFEMFKRLHTFTEYEGTGIGLAICKKIASSYNGSINLSSEEGKGSTFKISLKMEAAAVELVP